MKKSLKFLLCLVMTCVFLSISVPAQAQSGKVLCTTFPVFQITRNIALGVEGIEVELMIPARMGCPHNYSLTPGDMRKTAAAEILVINGLGMEEFLGAPLSNVNPDIVIIDSSRNIEGLLRYSSESSQEAGPDHHHDSEGHDNDHEGINPHLFASPWLAGRMAVNIASGLASNFPASAETLRANGSRYSDKMDVLAEEFRVLGKSLANNRIITQHGAFDYLARDAGLDISGIINVHGGEPLSAAGVIGLVKEIKRAGAGAVFTEPQYSAGIGRTIAEEAGIPWGELDPAASGPEDAPLDYYETVMRSNIKTLLQMLGARQ